MLRKKLCEDRRGIAVELFATQVTLRIGRQSQREEKSGVDITLMEFSISADVIHIGERLHIPANEVTQPY